MSQKLANNVFSTLAILGLLEMAYIIGYGLYDSGRENMRQEILCGKDGKGCITQIAPCDSKPEQSGKIREFIPISTPIPSETSERLHKQFYK